MPTEALPGERSVVLIETLNELEEHLLAGTNIDEGMFNAISMLLVDATLSGDDESLYEAIKKLKQMDLICLGGVRGRLLGYIDVVAWARKRIIPKSMLEQLTTGSSARLLLESLGRAQSGSTVRLLAINHDTEDELVEPHLHELFSNGFVSSRQVGREIVWEISPRGRDALHLTRP
jgi:hypothetical protein